MINIAELHPQFITDEGGNKQSVVLSITDFQELIENLEDLTVMAERKAEPTTDHAEFIEELKNDGLL